VIGPKTAAALTAWIEAQPIPEVATEERIDNMIAKLGMATKERQLSKEANDARLDLYCRALRDVPVIDLGKGFDDLLRTCTFMPTPAEVYQAAKKHTHQRDWKVHRAKHLVWLHRQEWSPPREDTGRPTSDEISAILHGTAEQFPSNRTS